MAKNKATKKSTKKTTKKNAIKKVVKSEDKNPTTTKTVTKKGEDKIKKVEKNIEKTAREMKKPEGVVVKSSLAQAALNKGPKDKKPAENGKSTAKEDPKPTSPQEIVKPTVSETPAKPKKEKKMTGLDAAALILKQEGKAMNTTEIMAVIKKDSLWETNGATPSATIYSSIIREIKTNRQGSKARFKRDAVQKGKFIPCVRMVRGTQRPTKPLCAILSGLAYR